MVYMGYKLLSRESSSDLVLRRRVLRSCKGRTVSHCFIKELIHLSLG